MCIYIYIYIYIYILIYCEVYPRRAELSSPATIVNVASGQQSPVPSNESTCSFQICVGG